MWIRSLRKFTIFAMVIYLYCAIAYLSLYLLNLKLPMWLENLIAGFAMPLNIISLPLLPVLKWVNGTDGQWQVAPNFWGVVVVASIYLLLAYWIVKLVIYIKRK